LISFRGKNWLSSLHSFASATTLLGDREIDEDFAETGRLRHMMEEVRGDARAGRLEEVP